MPTLSRDIHDQFPLTVYVCPECFYTHTGDSPQRALCERNHPEPVDVEVQPVPAETEESLEDRIAHLQQRIKELDAYIAEIRSWMPVDILREFDRVFGE